MIDFHELQQRDLQAIGQQKQRLQRLVLLRSASFLAMIFAFAAGFDGHRLGTLLGVLLLAAFLLLVRRHQQTSFEKLLTESHLGCVQSFLERKSGKWRGFADDGHDLLREDRPQENDLPILGRASLFQYLTSARTKAGRQKLASWLSPFPESTDAILLRQQAVRELSEAPQELLALEARSHLLPLGTDLSDFCTMLEQDNVRKSTALRLLSYLLPSLSFIALALSLAGQLDITVPGLLFSLQLLLTFLLLRRSQALLAPLMALPQELSVYEQLLAKMEAADYKSPLLLTIQKNSAPQRGCTASQSSPTSPPCGATSSSSSWPTPPASMTSTARRAPSPGRKPAAASCAATSQPGPKSKPCSPSPRPHSRAKPSAGPDCAPAA